MKIDRKQEIKKALKADKGLRRDGQCILFWIAILCLLTCMVMEYFFVILSVVVLEISLPILYIIYVLYSWNFTIEVERDGLSCYNWFSVKRRYKYEDLYLNKADRGFEIKAVKTNKYLFTVKNGAEYYLFKSWLIEYGVRLEGLK